MKQTNEPLMMTEDVEDLKELYDLELLEHDTESIEETLLAYERPLPRKPKLTQNYYNRSIDVIDIMSPEEEIAAGRMIQGALSLSMEDHSPNAMAIRDRADMAANVMTERFLRLVRSLVSQEFGFYQDRDDLIQEGNLGLMKAVKKFNPEKGFRFSTYAKPIIRQEVKRFIQGKSKNIHVPIHIHEHLNKVKSTVDFLTQWLDHQPTPLDIAVCIALGQEATRRLIEEGMDLSDYEGTLDFDANMPQAIESLALVPMERVGIEDPFGDNEDWSLSDTLVSEELEGLSPLDLSILTGLLKTMLQGLDKRQALIIACRYELCGFTKKTNEELGKILNLSRERVRQLEKEALAFLRKHEDVELLMDFVG